MSKWIIISDGKRINLDHFTYSLAWDETYEARIVAISAVYSHTPPHIIFQGKADECAVVLKRIDSLLDLYDVTAFPRADIDPIQAISA